MSRLLVPANGWTPKIPCLSSIPPAPPAIPKGYFTPPGDIYAYVTLKTGRQSSDELKKELVKMVRTEIGPHASPDKIQFTQGLPKTRSGKIMRRILRKISEGEIDKLGDTSTLADPNIVEDLISGRQ